MARLREREVDRGRPDHDTLRRVGPPRGPGRRHPDRQARPRDRGASGGGTETVRALAEAGAEVTVTVRRPETVAGLVPRAGAVRGAGRARAARLDLADIDSVRALTDNWEGPLDILVADAGIMALPDLERSGTGWELQLATNSPDHFALALGLPRCPPSCRLRTRRRGQFRNAPPSPCGSRGPAVRAHLLRPVGGLRPLEERDGAPRRRHRGTPDPGRNYRQLTHARVDHDTAATPPRPGDLAGRGCRRRGGKPCRAPLLESAEQGDATSVQLAASPSLEGVTGSCFEDDQEAPVTSDGATARRRPGAFGAISDPGHRWAGAGRGRAGRGFEENRPVSSHWAARASVPRKAGARFTLMGGVNDTNG
ncbi:SDR family NAD(P)-dependent oxidoreductase [Streptomyces lavenduligriseus]|uniref:SDR family NAD(P)-dependent oxidoreductase n=1 Tax=Streptomyces lavenduligriseus TaxID=67315 RepID=A0ABT0NZS8_9ACTN|nr:SDR family NAD(P)-dependent oxidoreductase [Streptomyces lavenduligriseus]MCL3996208.1 SDR family NAD(P)-dependent oxidoreductase [Streptomyces lavenduligriseus]